VNPVALVLAVVALVVSAVTKLHAVILGQPVVMPWLFVVAVIIALALAVALLFMIRLMVRDGLRLRPVVVRT
jgi:hypothetical protein